MWATGEKYLSAKSGTKAGEACESPALLIVRNEAPGPELGALRPHQEAGSAPWKGASKLPFLPPSLQDGVHEEQISMDKE